ncbi:MAG: hypothetical protein KAI47_12665 [Deltaproteobacteria bacterium]|nr:hypothetical protein [Deltaproteobacteria bacterium]
MALTRQQLYKLEDQLETLISNLDSYSYYQLLGIEPNASPEIVEFTYVKRISEYEEIRGEKRCTASLFQNLGKLLERLEEAHRILTDETLRAEYAQWLEAGHTRHLGANAKPRREEEERDEYIDKAAAALEKKLGVKMLSSEETEINDSGSWTIDLGEEGEAAVASGDIEGIEDHLRRDLDRLGVHDEEGEAEDESASLDRELLDETEAQLREDLDELGYEEEEAEAEDESASLDEAYIAEAEEALRRELEEMGVRDEDAEDDESVSLDRDYLERAARELERKLASDGVKNEEGEEEGRPASLDPEFIERAVRNLEKKLGMGKKSSSKRPGSQKTRGKAADDALVIDLDGD